MYSIDQMPVSSKRKIRIPIDILDKKSRAFYNHFNDKTHRLFILMKGD